MLVSIIGAIRGELGSDFYLYAFAAIVLLKYIMYGVKLSGILMVLNQPFLIQTVQLLSYLSYALDRH